MSEGLPPDPTAPQPPPSPPAQQSAAAGTNWQALAKQYLRPLFPPDDPAQDTPELKMQRMIYTLIAIGLGIFLLCGGLALVISVVR